MTQRGDWLVVGISGVTCGGKTTLARRLAAAVPGARLLHQDAYFLPDSHPRHVPVPGLLEPHNNYDILSALDMERMHSDAVAILNGAETSESSSAEDEDLEEFYCGPRLQLPGRRLLVLEGFTALNFRPLYDLCHLRYYIVLEYGECALRRSLRLYSPPDVAGYFEAAVWPMHLRYRAELEKDPTVSLLDGTQRDLLDAVLRDLRARGASQLGDTQ